MSLVISLGCNLGNKKENLTKAKLELQKEFKLLEESRIYESEAVDYLDQPNFYNQVLVFEKPNQNALVVLDSLLCIENKLGRIRNIPKGPRLIDIDLLFFGLDAVNEPNLTIPHPRLFERSFVVLPLKELSIYNTLCSKFEFPTSFCNEAFPLTHV